MTLDSSRVQSQDCLEIILVMMSWFGPEAHMLITFLFQCDEYRAPTGETRFQQELRPHPNLFWSLTD